MPRPRAERAATADRRAKLVEYRRRKVPYSQIYEELGYANANAASKDFYRTLEENIAGLRIGVEVYREEQLAELEHLAEEAHVVMRARHYVITPGGRLVEDPETGQPLLDPGPKLAAMDRLVKIGDRVAKLRGLDAATRIEGVFTVDALDHALIEAREQLAAIEAQDSEDGGAESPPG
ncbi:hypothetical protein DT019_02905 [Streptomyces sp. SDr-06]|uniref:hypothetical protein n=1 Tax=Streptomyces sp. SDr-06 TaxID=2267702 RepID=UPI000DE9AC52|nr:hypothetical protein [Streptomyces sp. SDr-06]RCH70452.1 hypothetical protein DT019_02905 [Streptomyces sp. SDr-06]